MSTEDQIKSITQRLSNLARSKDVSFQNIETVYFIEKMLLRVLQNEELSEKLVFKGGYVGLRAYESNRYTTDLDALLLSLIHI